MEGSNAAKAGTGIREVHLADSRFRMGSVSCGIRLALGDYVDSADFYSVVYCAENQELMGGSYNAWWAEWS